MTGMPRPRPKNLHRELTRHKKWVWYVRINKGPRIRIQAEYGTVEFDQQYKAALNGEVAQPVARTQVGSLAWLIERYRESAGWANLSLATRRQRENIFRNVCKTAGREPFTRIDRKTIVAGRDRRRETPNAARHFIQSMRGLFEWALEAEHVRADPTLGVKMVRPATDGFHVWSDDECEKFEKRWKVGTRERLAYDILTFTGLRRGDAVRLGRPHLVKKDGKSSLRIRTEKTGEVVTIPILAPLQASIDATPTGEMTYLATASGKPFKKESFGNWFRDACKEAKVPGSAHGLRKAGATRAANNGATVSELEAIFGWRGGGMAALYTKQADRERLAASGASKLVDEKKNVYSRTMQKSAGNSAKNKAISNR